jgi:hypothetical protein
MKSSKDRRDDKMTPWITLSKHVLRIAKRGGSVAARIFCACIRAYTWGHLTVKECADWYSNFAVLELIHPEDEGSNAPRNTDNSLLVDMA